MNLRLQLRLRLRWPKFFPSSATASATAQKVTFGRPLCTSPNFSGIDEIFPKSYHVTLYVERLQSCGPSILPCADGHTIYYVSCVKTRVPDKHSTLNTGNFEVIQATRSYNTSLERSHQFLKDRISVYKDIALI